MTNKILMVMLVCACFALQCDHAETETTARNTIPVSANRGELPGVYTYTPQRDITTYELAVLVPVLMESKLPRPEGMPPSAFPNGDLYQIFRFDYERLGRAARHLKVITEPSLPPKEIRPPKR